MAKCLTPTKAWICGTVVSKDGVLSPHIVFSSTEAFLYYERIGCLSLMDKNSIAVPCGKCVLCQMKKRKDMSVRLAHEASCHDNCCFLTLTYDDDHVPTTDWNSFDSVDENGMPLKQFDFGVGSLPEKTLYPRHVQLFIKRLRSYLDYHEGVKIRYFAVGEYGSKTHRPHYHVIIFGWRPSDLMPLGCSKGKPLYTSDLVHSFWSDGRGRKKTLLGFVSVSDVNPFVAKYAARYVTKKFARLDSPSRDYLVPEFTLQSTRGGGIGSTWFDRYGAQSCEVGFCTLRCSSCLVSKHAIPQYYWNRLRSKCLPLWVRLRDQRIKYVKAHPEPIPFDEICNIAACAVEQIKHETQKEKL